MSDPTMAEKNRFSRKAAVYILPLEYSPLFKVFYLAPCGRHKLWEDTVAYTYSHGALAEDKTISHKESPQKYSTQADFCLSSSSLLLASAYVHKILTKVCGGKTVRRWVDVWTCCLQQATGIQKILFWIKVVLSPKIWRCFRNMR